MVLWSLWCGDGDNAETCRVTQPSPFTQNTKLANCSFYGETFKLASHQILANYNVNTNFKPCGDYLHQVTWSRHPRHGTTYHNIWGLEASCAVQYKDTIRDTFSFQFWWFWRSMIFVEECRLN